MTITYTSADLAEIAASIPSRASEAGLIIVPGLDIVKAADVQLSPEKSSVEDALKLAGLVGAPFIGVESDDFLVEEFRTFYSDEDGDLPAAAEKLLKAAKKHEGSLISVKVNWVSQGLIYEWSAQCDWIASLFLQLDAAQEDAKAEAEAEDEESRDEYRAKFQAAVAALAESPRFRGEQPNKRSLAAPSILAEAGAEEPPPVFLSLRVMPEANRIVKAKAYEYEQDFRGRIPELANELREYPEWQRVYTKIKRKDAAIKFLIEKADGYRLSTDLAEEISEAAANPVYVSRY